MRTNFFGFSLALLMSAAQILIAPGLAAAQSVTNISADYAANFVVVWKAQQQALAQANQMLAAGEGGHDLAPLQTAIKQMRLAESALLAARNAPDKLPAALAAEQAAYQALLKAMPREYRMMQARSGRQGGGGAGEASQQEMNQLDMPKQENRYETESQATAPAGAQQREQSETADRLKELSQRQQDLNGRLRELQTQLPAARTDAERDELQRELKRLQDEQRQMLANVDELRQKLEQSPGTGSKADTQRQLEQTRNDMERAAQEMDRQSASGALAAGQRAQESMKKLGDNLRKETSSQFSDQMRQLRKEARDMTARQDEIARGLNSLNDSGYQALDNSAARQQISQQMQQQQSAVTNLLGQMRAVTEQAEASEPLLSKQLYDTWRRADQMHTENLLETGAQLTDRGFLPQAGEVERMTHTNITDLAAGVEHAADSVLGTEADALRYAGKELDNLTRQMERELGGADTNAVAGQAVGARRTNESGGRVAGGLGTNSPVQAGGPAPDNTSQVAGNNSRGQPSNASDRPGGQAASENPGPGRGSAPGQEPAQNQGQGENAGQGNRAGGNQPSPDGQGGNSQQASAENQSNSQEQGQGQAAGGNNPGRGNRGDGQQQAGNAPGADSPEQASAGAEGAGGDRLRQLAVQLGGGGGAGGLGRNGPITGNDYVSWSEHLSDVEQVVDQADLRNQLATVRERASALRAEYREHGVKPDPNVVRQQIVTPLNQVRVWLQDELAREQRSDSLVPLDRDPVPENYTELVRKYYGKLGNSP